MTEIDAAMTLGEIVDQHPSLATELERRNLDYCCGGRRTLAEACDEHGLDPDATAASLNGMAPDEPPGDWTGMDPTELVDHLEATHHRFLDEQLPRLAHLTEKIASVHGSNHPELLDVAQAFGCLRAELEPHLLKEERVLFPMVRELVAADEALLFHCGSVANPISVMLAEHDQAGDLLDLLVDLTNSFRTPSDGCASYRACFRGLAALDADTRLHIHKENNSLFPAVIALEERFTATVN
ncbi:MAG: iron-sulfur cluster repair di-iron protein [Actinobacteria bacterium]|nr:iron-sulfur cluster repair di-iron protein [Actinomycetota bacterium]